MNNSNALPLKVKATQQRSNAWRYLRVIKALGCSLIAFAFASRALPETSANASSPLGLNLNAVNYYSAEQPFLDIFKTASGFYATYEGGGVPDESKFINLDANGWPINLTALNDPNPQRFTRASILMLRDLPDTPNGNYPAGLYVVRYLGEGALRYDFDVKQREENLSKPGRDVINIVHPSTAGVQISIVSTDPRHTGNYIRNIQVVKAEQESALLAGQTFNPAFLSKLERFRVLRFMDWFNTNGNTSSKWATRSHPSDAIWATAAGVPYEVAVKLANATHADAWINVPVMADDDYISQLAELVHSQLGRSQKVYLELSNEVWNGGFSQEKYAESQGWVAFSTISDSFAANRNWYGMRTAQMCDLWKAVWGADFSRVVCVLGAQAAYTATAIDSLNCKAWTAGAPCSKHNIGAIAIAPYFGGGVPDSWPSQPDGGLASLFAAMNAQTDPSIPAGGWLAQSLHWVSQYQSELSKYHLPLIAYEGGQTFRSFPHGKNKDNSDNALTKLFIQANRDVRMRDAYKQYLQGWKANGGQLFVAFSSISTYSQYGEWGALESEMQATSPLESAPPKWQALQSFISDNSCWWPDCMAPVDPELKVQGTPKKH